MEPREGVDAGRQAADLLRAAGDLWGLSAVLGFLLVSLTSQGRFDEALAIDEELRPLAERLGNHGALMQHRRMTGLIGFFRSGDIDRLEGRARGPPVLRGRRPPLGRQRLVVARGTVPAG